MTGRELTIKAIHALVNKWPASKIKALADTLPVDIELAAKAFCKKTSHQSDLPESLVNYNISVPFELYQLIEQKTKGVHSTKGVKTNVK